MKRREFISLFGGAAATWPHAARSQQTATPHTIGILVLGNPDPVPFMTAFREGLRNLGYAEKRDIRLEFRSAGEDASALNGLAAELVRLKVDIIVAWQTPPAQAAKQATKEIPIVMTGVGDPVGTGLIASLAHPGGNVTGNTAIAAELQAKVVELIRETLPSARRVTVLANATDPFTKPFLAQIEQAALRLGIAIEPVMVEPSEKLDGYFDDIGQTPPDAVIIQPSLLHAGIAELALKHRLPTFSVDRQLPATGGLLSYGSIAVDQWRDAAVYVDKIIKGSRPADLPVAQPTRFALVINLKTAKELGLTIPPLLLVRADDVIE
jgi:putative ABC transport system substrate-binding protein